MNPDSSPPVHSPVCAHAGLSKRKIIEPSLPAFTGFPFALVFTCTFSECVTLRWPTTVTEKANHSRQNRFAQGKSKFSHGKSKFAHGKSKFAHGKSKWLTAKANSLTAKANCDISIAEVNKGWYSSQQGIGFTHDSFPLTLASRVTANIVYLLISYI